MKLRIPATSANLGPGFDTIGLALSLYQYLEVEEDRESNLKKGHLVYDAYAKTFAYVGKDPLAANFNFYGDIPRSRGLGSSAACIVAGITSANELGKLGLGQDQLLEIATEMEGHPDNVAPALFGGLVYAMRDGGLYYKKVSVSSNLVFTLLIPRDELLTDVARDLLPKKVPMEDAIFNLSHLPFLIEAFEKGDFDLLKVASQDRLHEQYRAKYIPYFLDLKESLKDKACVHISGAGSTSLMISKESILQDLEEIVQEGVQILEVSVDGEGVKKIKQ